MVQHTMPTAFIGYGNQAWTFILNVYTCNKYTCTYYLHKVCTLFLRERECSCPNPNPDLFRCDDIEVIQETTDCTPACCTGILGR